MSTNRPPSRNRSVLVVLLALSVSCFAAEPPKELTALKENFAKALERTTKPLQSAYETELRKLIEKHTKAGEFDAAVAVKTELEGKTPAANAPQPPASMVELKGNYTKALERAREPMNKTYEAELQKLLDRFTKTGNLDAALAVKDEVAGLSAAPVAVTAPVAPTEGRTAPTPAESKSKRLTRSEKKAIEDRFMQTMWTILPAKVDCYYFHKDGACSRGEFGKGSATAATGKWEMEDDGSVCIKYVGGDKKWAWFSSNQAGEFAATQKDARRMGFEMVSGATEPQRKK